MRRAATILFALLAGCQTPAAPPSPLSVTPPIASDAPSRPAIVRPPAVAGSWYPGDASDLAKTIDDLLASVPKARVLGGPVRALIAPHAGYSFSGSTAASAFKLVQGAAYERVIVIGPAHDVPLHGAGLEDYTHYRTPLGDIPIDDAAVRALKDKPLFSDGTEAGKKEHSIEMELPFLQRALAPGWKLVPVLIGSVDAAEARAVAEGLRTIAGERTLIVASGDFTHYGVEYGYTPYPQTPDLPAKLEQLDKGFFEQIANLDGEGVIAYEKRTSINSCGFFGFVVLADLLSPDVRPLLVRYDASGKHGGDWKASVGYVAASFSGPHAPSEASLALPRSDMRSLLTIAMKALDQAVTTRKKLDYAPIRQGLSLSPAVEKNGAAFVTLYEKHELRGCIGALAATEPLWKSVADHALMAALEDDRFSPVKPEELPAMEVEVSVLSPTKTIGSPRDVRLGADGLIIEKAGKKGVFLPEVATEQGWTLDDLLEEIGIKAGLDRKAWREGATFSTFTSQTIQGPFRR